MLQERDPWFTILTCTYNRADRLPRAYEALKKMEMPLDDKGVPVGFEWVIVDDGSTDATRDMVADWIKEGEIDIRYYFQPNQGKHVATNLGVKESRGFAVVENDSDDTLMPNALKVMYGGWQSLSEEERKVCKGVTARCIDMATGRLLGRPLKKRRLFVPAQDLRFKVHAEGEMCGFNRRSILTEHPYPVVDKVARFYPEAILWYEIGKEYSELVIDIPIRRYYTAESDSITQGSSRNRAPQNYHLWKYTVNNLFGKYFFNSPKEMMKGIVGVTMDGFRTGRSLRTILGDIDTLAMKAMVVIFSPAGWILSRSK